MTETRSSWQNLLIYASCVAVTVGIAYIFSYNQNKSKKKKTVSKFSKAFSGDSVKSVSSHTDEQSFLMASRFISEVLDMRRNGYTDRNIYIKNIDGLKAKLSKIFSGGLSKLQIISDFDRTMTKFSHNGKLVPTCHGVLESNPQMSEEAKQIVNHLRETYYPIEVDPSLTEAEKTPFMLEWWEKAHETVVQARLQQDRLKQCVDEAGIVLRDGVEDFLRRLDESDVPILIFSAGVGNIIEEFLVHANCCHDNIRVVSNFMNFDADGIIIGFQGQVIHSFNKSAASVVDSAYYHETSDGRECVLLFGDSTGDPRMSDGIDEHSTVLKVGFLNDRVPCSLETYKNLFDIVLVGDDTFDVAHLLLDFIERKEVSEIV